MENENYGEWTDKSLEEVNVKLISSSAGILECMECGRRWSASGHRQGWWICPYFDCNKPEDWVDEIDEDEELELQKILEQDNLEFADDSREWVRCKECGEEWRVGNGYWWICPQNGCNKPEALKAAED